MKTYTLCGSMRFSKEMQEIAYELETHEGYNILQCAYCAEGVTPTEKELACLRDAHYKKIDLSDGIYVINIDGYIGDAVKLEIEYAKKHDKEIIYYCS